MSNEQFSIQPATREGVRPLIGLFGKSGSGKTMSALLLARGLVGDTGRITLIDSESRRGSIFADLIPGGYNVIDIEPPFSPARLVEAFRLAEDNSDCIVIDSISHFWEGEGGVLDMQEAELDRMAGQDWKKREGCKMAAWIKPKQEAKKLHQGTILRSKLPVIVCFRAQEKTKMEKVDGKTKVSTDDFSSPIYDSRFIFELLINAETLQQDGQGGFTRITKITHPDVAACLPRAGEQLGVIHGKLIAQWAHGGKEQTTLPEENGAALKKQLWKIAKPHHVDVKDFEQWLWDEGIIMDTEALAELPPDRLKTVLATVTLKYA